MRAFSSRDWRLVAAVNPFMSVSITATFSVRIRKRRASHAGRNRSRRASPHAGSVLHADRDPDVALLGLSFPNEQDAAFAAAAAFAPLTSAEMAETRRRAADAIAGKGPVWWDPPRAARGHG